MPVIKPIVIAIWCGIGKPKDLDEFLLPLVVELNEITRTGIFFNDYRIDIVCKGFLADSPARSFIKGIAYFNGKHGCQKCTIVGTYFRDVHRTCFPEFDLPLRTDSGFRSREQPLHHKRDSPLEKLTKANGFPSLDMVKDFPTSDSLHLLDEGIMKRSINLWCKEIWTPDDLNQINQLIYDCNKELPSDVHRQLRSLKYKKYFKATEFRTILLYVGIVIFKDSLPERIYEHFLRLFLGVRLSSCRAYVAKNNLKKLARLLFSEYCIGFADIYGQNSVVSNVHNVVHIADDVERFGPLTEFSTYPFENFLRLLKLNTQPSKTPLEQITRRLAELSFDTKNGPLNFHTMHLERRTWQPELKYEFKSENWIAFKYIRVTPNVFLSNRKKGDSYFLTWKNQIVKMKFAIKKINSFFICGSELKQKTDFFKRPYSSHLSDIYNSLDEFSDEDEFFNVNEIKSKMVCLSYQNQFIFIPLLHSIDECVEYSSN